MQNKKNVKINEKVDEIIDDLVDEEVDEVIDDASINDEQSQTTEDECEDSLENCLEEELEQVKNKMLRLQADFLNYKNRTEKEKLSTYGNAVSDILLELLPVVDNFERALEVEAPTSEVETFKEGMKMIEKQFRNVLDKNGLKEIEAMDAKFDPNFHQGIAFDNESDKEEDTITEVFQKGYMVKDKVIRPSVVKIAK